MCRFISLLSLRHKSTVHFKHPLLEIFELVSGNKDRIDSATILLLKHNNHRVLINLRPAWLIPEIEFTTQNYRLVDSIHHLNPSLHSGIFLIPVIKQCLRPPLILIGNNVNTPVKKESLIISVIPSTTGSNRILVIPSVGLSIKFNNIFLRKILQTVGHKEKGIGKHLHTLLKDKQITLGIIVADLTFNQRAIFIHHRPSPLKMGDTILCIIIQEPGSEHIAILIHQLDNMSPESGKVLIYQIFETVSCKDCLFLNNLHISHRINHPFVHIPQSIVTFEIGIIMKKKCISLNLSETLTINLQQTGLIGRYQTDKTILLLILSKNRQREKNQNYI